ncbi:MAG: TonB-dependent receptor, partial [Acidobacteriaceae bacterium]|nr:TonB-dependent receptor [Acidobacteriaceae bacterium]
MSVLYPLILIRFALLFAAVFAFGGSDAASISGTVTDPTGAPIPEIRVSVRETNTGLQRTTMTNHDGFYAFPALPVGAYEIAIQQEGFAPYHATGLRLDANRAVRADATLELGARSETVSVLDTALQVATAETQMGEIVSGRAVSATPLNGRSFTDLLALQPGVVPISSQQPNAVVMGGVTTAIAPSGDLNAGNLSISGQRETANGFLVNGSDVEEDVNMGTCIIPNLDSISEFRILTNNFDAEYGNYSGGQILVVTKSGTNQFHGNVFEYIRNTDLDARNFFSAGRARFQQNQFGATLGGPIRHDKIHFFADYQGTRMMQGIDTGLITVPSLADRSGNLADLAGSLTGTVSGGFWAQQLAQRLGYAVAAGEPYYMAGCTSSAQCVFPNAQIPRSAWSAPALKLLPYIPSPNEGANVFATATYNERLRDDKAALRMDAQTRWGLWSLYYFADDYSLNNPYPAAQGGANVPGFNALNLGRAQLASVSDVTSFGSSAVNEFHLSFMRTANVVGQPVGGVGASLASQGFTNIVPLAPAIEGIENMAFNDFTIGVDTTGLTQVNNTYEAIDNYSKVIGRHTLKFGGEYHFDQINTNPDSQYNGSFVFEGTETGSDFADFLLGIASSYTQGSGESFYNRTQYAGLFAQDSWRAKPNLTLNVGVRWDRISPWWEKYNQLQTLRLGEQSQVYPGAPVGLVFPGDPGVPDTLAPVRNLNFSPRIGIAYSPAASTGWLGRLFGGPENTSIRGGYGMFYTAFEGLSAGIMSANPPFGSSYTSPGPPLVTNPFITAASGQNYGQPFPLPFVPFGATPAHPDANIDWSRYEPLNGIPAFDPDNRVPYSDNFMFSLERKFGASTVVTASYVGAEAHHLLAL